MVAFGWSAPSVDAGMAIGRQIDVLAQSANNIATGRESTIAFSIKWWVRRPMVQVGSRYETGAKSFLGTTIDANTPASQSLTLALDAICAHPNVAPFLCRQLIQRLLTSNPSPAYMTRIAGVFNNDGSGVRGNLRAVQ
jgi:hypothetical protein